jgi:hypothetical protein
MKVLIMYLRFPIFKFLPSSSPKLYLLHFKNLFWCLFNVNFCHNFAKLHRSHMTLNPFEILLKHGRQCLLPSLKISAHLTSYNERSCYFFEVTSNWDLNTKWLTTHSHQFQTPWDFGRHIDICFLHLLKISTLLMMTTKSYHSKNKLTSKLRLKL